MKIKVFDVVELKNGNKATILEENKGIYKVEIINDNGKSKKIAKLSEKDISKVIFA